MFCQFSHFSVYVGYGFLSENGSHGSKVGNLFICVFVFFNEKTVTAMISLQKKLSINDGTIKFTRLVTNWFHIMNVKDKYTCIKLKDSFRSPTSVTVTRLII